MKKTMKLSVVIPAYNEEERIKNALEEVTGHLNKMSVDYEVIVVDDGSADSTANVVESYNDPGVRLVRNERNRGKGYSVKTGMLASSGDYTLFTDADTSTPITQLDKFMEQAKEFPVVIASRNLPESDITVRQGRFRVLLGKTFPLIVRLLLFSDIKDTQCGFKLFRKDAVKEIFNRQTINGFAFDVETLFIAKKHGIRIREMPVPWKNDANSRVDIKKHVPAMLAEILKIRINDLLGVYTR